MKKYPLTLFQLLGKRRLLQFLTPGFLLLFASIATLFLSLPSWIAVLLGMSAFVCFIFAIYYAAILPQTVIIVHQQHIVISNPFREIHIPFKEISAIYRASLQEYYPDEQLQPRDLQLLEPIYEEHAVFIELHKRDKNLEKSWLPAFLLTPIKHEINGVILNVPDWIVLHKRLEASYKNWRSHRDIDVTEEDTAQKAPPPVELKTSSNDIMIESTMVDAFPEVPPFTTTDDSQTLPLILAVEDNDQILIILKTILAQHYRVITATNGSQGLRLAKAKRPDLIITDMMMPIMTGEEMLIALRNDTDLRRIPVIFLTVSDEIQTKINILNMGADDYLTKPFHEAELLVRIRNHLKSYMQEQELARLNWQMEAKIEDQMAELIRRGDLIRFLPDSVAQNVMSGQIGPAATFERRYITVLFVDIVGFTTITDKLEPSVLASFLNEYLREMTAVSIVHGGTVDKFIGDALMVNFGAPDKVDPREQAWQAVQTAVAMKQQIKEMANNWHQTIPYNINVRIGINTGECTIGVFGSDLLQSYTAVGSPVNIAARLQGAAPIGGIISGPITFKLVRQRVFAKPLKPLALKGVSRPVPAFLIQKLRFPPSEQS